MALLGSYVSSGVFAFLADGSERWGLVIFLVVRGCWVVGVAWSSLQSRVRKKVEK